MNRCGLPTWFTAHDARILGRLRNGLAKPSDLSDASPNFLPVARRLFLAPLTARHGMTDEWLRGCDDAEAIRRAAIDTDSMGPAPAKAELPPGRGAPQVVDVMRRPPVIEPDPRPPAPARADPAAKGRPIVPGVRLNCCADIVPRELEWLWAGRVPIGMLTMFAGDPKLGKSYVALSIAAAITRGAPLPGGAVSDGPGSVIIMSAEDEKSRTIVPRLKAADADLSKIHILESIVMIDGHPAPPNLDTDLPAIEAAIADLGDCRLILIDPITAYLGRVDDHRNSKLRGLLARFGEMAERLKAAVILVSHLSKFGGSNGKHRVMGSMAYEGVCRSNMIFIRDRTDPTSRRVLLCDNGGNRATSPPTLAYTIQERLLGPVVVFDPEPVAITTEQALDDEIQRGIDPGAASERREAQGWLKETLAAGPLTVREVEDTAKARGFSASVIKRARQAIAVVVIRSGFGKGAVYQWALPTDSSPRPASQ
jgi:putative DNA primase/helicase